jgi:hypothetical protein
MEELFEIRRLKEEGLTNPKVLEYLEEQRAKRKSGGSSAAAEKGKGKGRRGAKAAAVVEEVEEDEEEEEEVRPAKKATRSGGKTAERRGKRVQAAEEVEESEETEEEAEQEPAIAGGEELGTGGRSKHSLTCQTCGKVFEHMNPRLRDCLDCYRAKRKERRRGGSDRHKNVIQHPVAQQVASKAASQQSESKSTTISYGGYGAPAPPSAAPAHNIAEAPIVIPQQVMPTVSRKTAVRNYRKAIEETRQITSNLKRRLERPDLPEGERRWLEQIYAYQLILHQGWRHLAEYKSETHSQSKVEA